MKKIMVLVRYIVKDGKREAFLKQIIDEGILKASLAEDGNEKYDYYFPADSEDALCLCEIWRDAEALKAHGSMPHYLRLGELKVEYVESVSLSKYEIEAM